MPNPADRAAIEAAQANATASRRDASMLLESGAENARRFTESAEQQLARGMVALGKTGNLSVEENALPESGIALGSTDTEESKAYRKTVTDRIAEIRKNRNFRSDENAAPGTPHRELWDLEQSLNAMGPEGSTVADIRNPEALRHASGSDLLTMVTTRDSFERDKRTIMRGAKNEAMTMLLSGENYDEQANWAKKAMDYNTFQTILGTGLKIGGMFL
jgi:hypothetical protein